jgi:hypothetical protein
MTFENGQEQDQEQSAASSDAGADGAGGADDLAGVLGGQDATFVTGEKKPLNTGTLVMAGFLVACGIGTYVMYTRNAAANAKPSAESAAAQTTITQFLNEDQANVSKMKDLLQNTQVAVEQFKNSPGKAQVPVEDLRTNPFRFSDAEPAPTGDADTDTITARKREAEARAATLKAAQALNLQFIVSGRKKSCLINNSRYAEGDAVGEFVIESISADAVVVKKGESRFELRMKK